MPSGTIGRKRHPARFGDRTSTVCTAGSAGRSESSRQETVDLTFRACSQKSKPCTFIIRHWTSRGVPLQRGELQRTRAQVHAWAELRSAPHLRELLKGVSEAQQRRLGKGARKEADADRQTPDVAR